MVAAQASFAGGRERQQYQSQRSKIADAYRAIGVSPDVDNRELKRAYRRLMSENHPDKLSARGVPKEMVDVATERSKNITTAYDLIKEFRNLR
jgi:DnaJ like chaperone protein